MMSLASMGATATGFGINGVVLGVVLLGVVVLMLAVKAVGHFAVATLPAEKSPGLVVEPGAPMAEDASPELDARLIAVLTAAATAAIGNRVSLLQVSEVHLGNVNEQRAWAREGRREVYLSHRLRY